MVSELDEKMLQLNEAIQECILKESDQERLEGVCRDVIGSRREEQKLMSAGLQQKTLKKKIKKAEKSQQKRLVLYKSRNKN